MEYGYRTRAREVGENRSGEDQLLVSHQSVFRNHIAGNDFGKTELRLQFPPPAPLGSSLFGRAALDPARQAGGRQQTPI
jgi:hypothetical protein